MAEFIENACSMYEELSGRTPTPNPSPYVSEGSLTDDDWVERGTLSNEASKVFMKILWRATLARPGLMKAIADLTRRLTVWARADDKRLHCLMCYLFGSKKVPLPILLRSCTCACTLTRITVQPKGTQSLQAECISIWKARLVFGRCLGPVRNRPLLQGLPQKQRCFRWG